ncbi:hypothetical protein TrCOL_g3623 [Triparma columacea]|uniref:Uncharacterized protein n=1 Tax=Triparma columacea TaxID=722753 RepID=A0A9W7GD60_9STRA|nr:hypothetical protein TrCOL_g3623 [Triparma columacea]
MNLLISFILSLIFAPLTTSVPTKPIIINADSTTTISTPLQPPLGGNYLSLSIISPSRDDLSIFADQITVAVLVSSLSPSPIDVCLEVNGQWGGCKAVKGGQGDVLVDFELEDIPTGEYTAVVGAGEARSIRTFKIIPLSSCTPPSPPPPIIDGFLYTSEISMLHLRLLTLSPFVSNFILVESSQTFTGLPKPLHFNDIARHDPRIKPYLSKITVVTVTTFPHTLTSPWDREYYQRDQITDVALTLFPPNPPEFDPFVVISDVDEIPSPSSLKAMKTCAQFAPTLTTLRSDYYYYSFNWKKNGYWYGIQVSRLSVFNATNSRFKGSDIRRILGYFGGPKSTEYEDVPKGMEIMPWGSVDVVGMLKGGGWHLSYFTRDVEEVLEKVKAFSHQEYKTEGVEGRIRRDWDEIRKEGRDLWGREREGEGMVWVDRGEKTLPERAQEFGEFWEEGVGGGGKGGGEGRGGFKNVTLGRLKDHYRNGGRVGGNGLKCGYETGVGTDGPGARVAIGVVSARGNRGLRDAIRETWLRHGELGELEGSGITWEYAFFVGLDGEGYVGKELVDEMNQFGDIVVVGEEDTYRNMIEKVVAIFEWGANCKATYIARVNDDVYLRLGAVLRTLFSPPVLPASIYAGYFITSVSVLRPSPPPPGSRAPVKNSAVNVSTYPSDVYPDFAQGNGYIISADLVPGLCEWIRGRRERFADDIMVGLYMDGVGATKVMVETDFVSDGGAFVCREESFWHFDVGEEIIRKIWDNEVNGRRRCEGIGGQ